jgi:oligopeptide/dipeptide ABC transporter ATP-binding protein
MSEVLLRVDELVKHYPLRPGLLSKRGGAVRAVDGVSFAIGRGETLGLVGESGCGKSTVARMVLRLEKPTAGRVFFDGTDFLSLKSGALRAKRRELQIVFQDPMGSLNPRMTVGEILAEPLRVHRVASGRELDARVALLLEQVGIPASWRSRYPHEFSGGQRQRIGVARAIALGPKLVVCDEAVSALDVSVQAQVLNLLLELRERLGLAYLFISHDLSVVRHVSDRVAVMYLGQIVEQAPTAALFESPAHPSTRALLSAIPVPDPRRRRERIVLAGDVPSPANPPAGCRFHTRCPAVMARCSREEPPAYAVGEGHQVRCFLADPGGTGSATG